MKAYLLVTRPTKRHTNATISNCTKLWKTQDDSQSNGRIRNEDEEENKELQEDDELSL